jgi:hypothetical protein
MTGLIGTAPTNTKPKSVVEVKVKTRYTKALDTTGWLRIKLEPSGANEYLCEFVKVLITKEDTRTYFTVLDGIHKGKNGSLAKENAAKCLVENPRGTGAKITAKTIGRKKLISVPRGDGLELNQLLATLTFDGKSATITLDSDVDYKESNPMSPNYNKVVHSEPLPKGSYKILAPQSPKKPGATAFYATNPGGYPALKYHTVWFPVEYAPTINSNFVHVGNLSEGCVTMYQLDMWNPLYLYLISHRSDKDGNYVGTLTIE